MKYFISHRGNLMGRVPMMENTSSYIQKALLEGYDVEIDIWIRDEIFYLGHDGPEQNVSLEWLNERKDKLWIHCKSLETLSFFNESNLSFNYFFLLLTAIYLQITAISLKRFIFRGVQRCIRSRSRR